MDGFEGHGPDFGRGIIIRTIEGSDPNPMRKLLPKITLLTIPVGWITGILLYFLHPDVFLLVSFLIIFIMTIAGLLYYIVIKAILGRGFVPIQIYSSGIQFHLFLFDQMRGSNGYVGKNDIDMVYVSSVWNVGPGANQGDYSSFSVHTKDKKVYQSGPRLKHDIDSVINWMKKEWGIKVVESGMNQGGAQMASPITPTPSSTTVRAHKVPVAPTPRPAPAPAYRPPPMEFCRSCGAGMVKGSRFCPACGYQIGGVPEVKQSTVTYPPANYSQQTIPIHTPVPPYDQKSPKVAVGLALLGFIGMMGIGQMYMRRWVKGVALFFIGGFLALLALATLTMIFSESTYDIWVSITSAAFFNGLFFAVLGWSIMDASRTAKKYNAGVP